MKGSLITRYVMNRLPQPQVLRVAFGFALVQHITALKLGYPVQVHTGGILLFLSANYFVDMIDYFFNFFVQV